MRSYARFGRLRSAAALRPLQGRIALRASTSIGKSSYLGVSPRLRSSQLDDDNWLGGSTVILQFASTRSAKTVEDELARSSSLLTPEEYESLRKLEVMPERASQRRGREQRELREALAASLQRQARRRQRAQSRRESRGAWQPRRKISRAQMAELRSLHAHDPDVWTHTALGKKYGVSVEAVRRILRSTFTPSEDRAQAQDEARVTHNAYVSTEPFYFLDEDVEDGDDSDEEVDVVPAPTASLDDAKEARGSKRTTFASATVQSRENPE